MPRRLLLLSNSTYAGEPFLSFARPHLVSFLGDSARKLAFVPFAAVRFSFDRYEALVREALSPSGYEVTSVHRSGDPKEVVGEADAVLVGGGNTFALTRELYEANLVETIRERVNAGLPYVGWSAGANVACPMLSTTNDMPIVQPPSFRTFGLVPFQINPHYTDVLPPGHAGETRDERIEEFVIANPEVDVIGLWEGTGLQIEGDSMRLLGSRPARLFSAGRSREELAPGADLGYLLRG